ncbi:MAG: hypothetical protein H6737_13070 [Alphaproteobacteria bacterium]|nr:hypothetical protein [Alphaproteobacteria bacterium]
MLLFALLACKPPDDEVVTGVPDEPGNNPIVPEVALFPWPSNLWLEPDPTTRTGLHLALPDEHMPDVGGSALFADQDGFSRVAPILTHFPEGIDGSTLPTLPQTVEPDSPVLLVDAGTLTLTPALVELDGYANVAQQSLIIRPQVTLAPDTNYVVLVRKGVRSLAGEDLRVTKAFRALRDGLATDSSVAESLRADFQPVNTVIEGLGIDPEDVVSGWTFHTRSEGQILDKAVAMHDIVAGASLGTWTEVSREDDGANWVIEGVVDVPDFLGPDDRIALDADGVPIVEGTRPMDFLVTIPHTVVAPRPTMVFGHGFFSAKEEPTWGSLQQLIQPWQIPTVSTSFLGFTEDDLASSAGALGGDVESLLAVVDMQLQSHANHTALARIIEDQLEDDIVIDGPSGPFQPLDASRIDYMGISNGGTQGYTLLTASPKFTRGALVVGGGGWSHITQRATQWNTMGAIISTKYPDDRELQLVLALMQQVLDPIDSLNFVEHLVDDRLPGRPPVEVSLHMAVGDCQVHNMTTEWVARSAGIPLVTPTVRDVWGLETIAGSSNGLDVPAGLIIYDEGFDVTPDNVAPPVDNGAHESIRDLASYKENVGRFLETGDIVDVCDGPCDPD